MCSSDLAGNFTVEAWIYPTQQNVVQGIFNNWNIGGAFIFEITPGNVLRFNATIAPSGVSSSQIVGVTTISTNTWTHVAAVRYNNVLTLYVNGQVDVYQNINYTMYYYNGVTKDLYIGSAADFGGYFVGLMLSMRIIKGDAAYTSAFTPKVLYDNNIYTVL